MYFNYVSMVVTCGLYAELLSVKTTNAKEKQYKLFAVVYHDGKEASKGHYVTDAFHVGYSSWLRYDDAAVKQVILFFIYRVIQNSHRRIIKCIISNLSNSFCAKRRFF